MEPGRAGFEGCLVTQVHRARGCDQAAVAHLDVDVLVKPVHLVEQLHQDALHLPAHHTVPFTCIYVYTTTVCTNHAKGKLHSFNAQPPKQAT